MTVVDSMSSGLESYLVTTFSQIQDQYGQKLDISPALPTLVQVLTGHIDAVKKYEFIGEAACQFGVRCILARVYNKMNDRILDALAKKYRSLGLMNKLVVKEIQLKRQPVLVHPNIIPLISGVLFSFFGTTAVEKFIENAVLQIAAIELGEASAKLKKQEEGPLARFNQIIAKEGGKVEFTPQAVIIEKNNMHWQVTLTARLNNSSSLFSHKRTEASVKKAKQAATKDVLQYFEKHLEEFEKFRVNGTLSNVVHPLPILKSEYSIIETPEKKPTTPITIKLEQPFDATYLPDYHNISYSSDEDAIRKLSALLLGNTMDEEMSDENESPTKKRMRESEQHTGLNGMMISKDEQPTEEQLDVKIKSEFDYEQIRQQLLSSNQSVDEEEVHVNQVQNITNTPAPVNPYDVPSPEINPRILHYFKTLFRNNRGTLSHCLELPGQSKSIFLSVIIQHGDKVKCDSDLKQVGPPHAPVFSASVKLQSKEYQNVFIITEATAARKKDAECQAYQKLTQIFN